MHADVNQFANSLALIYSSKWQGRLSMDQFEPVCLAHVTTPGLSFWWHYEFDILRFASHPSFVDWKWSLLLLLTLILVFF